MRTGWYARWFGEEYLQLYPHRDQREARRAIKMVLTCCAVEAGSRVLDLACGMGRHLRELQNHRFNAFGLDPSLPLLEHARTAGLMVVRGDMRELPFASGGFALVTSFFTSFGYFADPADDLRVLMEVQRVLRRGGTFTFDFLNANRVRERLRPRDEREVNGMRVIQTRALMDGGRYVEERIEIHDPSDRLPRIFYERVRLYSTDELQRLMADHGLNSTHTFGDYDGSAFSPDSPRVGLIGRAA